MIIEIESNGINVKMGRDDEIQRQVTDLQMQEIDKLTMIAVLIGGEWSLEGDSYNSYNLHRDGGCKDGGITLHFYRDWRDEKAVGKRDYWRFKVSGSYPTTPRGHYNFTPKDAPSQNVNIGDPAKAGLPIMRMIPGIEAATLEVRKKICEIMEQRARYTENAQRMFALAGKSREYFDPSSHEAVAYIPMPKGADISATMYSGGANEVHIRMSGLSLDEVIAIRDLIVGMRTSAQPLMSL